MVQRVLLSWHPACSVGSISKSPKINMLVAFQGLLSFPGTKGDSQAHQWLQNLTIKVVRLSVVVWYPGEVVRLSCCLGWDAVLPKSLYIQGQRQQHKGPWTGSWHKSLPNKLRSLFSVEAREGIWNSRKWDWVVGIHP